MAASTISIEAWALRIACGIAMDLNLDEDVFEFDCLELINCFKEPNSATPWEIRAMIEDIKRWASSKMWSFVWCPMEMNRVANWLATNCLSFFSGLYSA
ncbi:hypothetical protein RHMOL_Rhmol01G0186900 [Rhododendron molle]|uniref:Uncharacterized protein n=1 Tax=Rhododendron molle TaxID=49168 RepID=A0ACC0Q2N8_RHOML|nr:hypothetical protein RHMOL_Rhmol01G0186900 [Rhododendron molle]